MVEVPVVEVSVRLARPDDAAAVASIWWAGWLAAHLGRVPEELAAARTGASFAERATARVRGADDAVTLVAEVDGAVAGFAMVLADEVEQLYVDHRFHGRGVAAPLLDAAEAEVAEFGHRRAWLAVVAGNARARAFYERRGWADEGPFEHRAPGGFTVPCHRYAKPV